MSEDSGIKGRLRGWAGRRKGSAGPAPRLRDGAKLGPMGERYCSENCYELGGQTVSRHIIQGWSGDCSVCRGPLSIGMGMRGSMVCYKPGLFLYFHQQASCEGAVRTELAKSMQCVVCGQFVGVAL